MAYAWQKLYGSPVSAVVVGMLAPLESEPSPLVTVEDEDVPLTEPLDVTVEDEDVPLAELPELSLPAAESFPCLSGHAGNRPSDSRNVTLLE